MSANVFTDRQFMQDPYYEFYHYRDDSPLFVDFHQHTFYEVFFLVSGSVTYFIEGKIYHLRPGDILLTNTFDIHRPEVSPGEPYERFVIWVSDSFFDRMKMCGDDLKTCFLDAASREYRLIRPDPSTLAHLKALCKRMEEAQDDPSPGKHVLSTSLLLQFFVYLNRCCHETPSSCLEDITENKTINQIVRYINENISIDLSLDDLAERFFINKFYLCKQFKHFTGMSVYQYIVKKRLTLSLTMLRKGMSATNACQKCGFNDYSNFLKAFKREFGKNPRFFINFDPCYCKSSALPR